MKSRFKTLLLSWIVILSSALTAQTLDRRFFYQVSPNYSFGSLGTNSPKINARQVFIPFFAVGVGYYAPLKGQWYIDGAFEFHGTYYKIKTDFATTGSSVFLPMLQFNLSRFFLSESEKYALVPQVGYAIAYSFEDQANATITDTLTREQLELDHYRAGGLNSFLQVGLGILFKFKKRNMLVSFLYAQGLKPMYKIDLTHLYTNTHDQARFVGRDSYVALQVRLFLKNKNINGTTTPTVE